MVLVFDNRQHTSFFGFRHLIFVRSTTTSKYSVIPCNGRNDDRGQIAFAHTSFKWANLASHNAGVTVVTIGISKHVGKFRRLFSIGEYNESIEKKSNNINAYLVAAADVIVNAKRSCPKDRSPIDAGGKPVDSGNLLLSIAEKRKLIEQRPERANLIKRVYGSREYINGLIRYCLWITDNQLSEIKLDKEIQKRLNKVSEARLKSPKKPTQNGAKWPHKFEEVKQSGNEEIIIIPKLSSENREYLPVGLLPKNSIITDLAFGQYNTPLWNMALIASRMHLVWVATVCGKMKTDFRYSNTLGWNTFPVPKLTEKNKNDLTACAEDILLAREAHFPATIADLYEVKDGVSKIPENLHHAHDRNDEVLERIYIGRRFKNDTERLEKLFDLYIQMTNKGSAAKIAKE